MDTLQWIGVATLLAAVYLMLYTGWIWLLAKICKKDWKEQWKWWHG